MLYIKQEDRSALVGRARSEDIQDRVDAPLDEYHSLIVSVEGIENAGELNFVLTTIIRDYFERNGGRYQQINDIVGALEGAKLEFYRRVAAPYEDTKIVENGDVY